MGAIGPAVQFEVSNKKVDVVASILFATLLSTSITPIRPTHRRRGARETANSPSEHRISRSLQPPRPNSQTEIRRGCREAGSRGEDPAQPQP